MELTAAEGRVLGCLIELEAASPESAPFTLNALRLACNQATGREPVVAYDDRTVEDTLLALKSRGLARFIPPTDAVRTTRYRQRADERWRMGAVELAVLAVLLLRGVQTASQVRSHAQHLQPVATASEVDAVLDTLAARTPRPFAARVGGRGGEQPARWVEVLTAPAPEFVGADDGAPAAGHLAASSGGAGARAATPAVAVTPAELASPSYAQLVARVADLEDRLAEALERRAPVAGDWASPAYAPPPPPVEVRRVRPVQAQLPPVGDDGWRSARHLSESPAGSPGAGLAELADRLADIERRLTRIEAELGALR
jgi:uncharacterized protein YceH (UPF0502 family)